MATGSGTYTERYCIIGAGASGITASKHPQQLGILREVIKHHSYRLRLERYIRQLGATDAISCMWVK